MRERSSETLLQGSKPLPPADFFWEPAGGSSTVAYTTKISCSCMHALGRLNYAYQSFQLDNIHILFFMRKSPLIITSQNFPDYASSRLASVSTYQILIFADTTYVKVL